MLELLLWNSCEYDLCVMSLLILVLEMYPLVVVYLLGFASDLMRVPVKSQRGP